MLPPNTGKRQLTRWALPVGSLLLLFVGPVVRPFVVSFPDTQWVVAAEGVSVFEEDAPAHGYSYHRGNSSQSWSLRLGWVVYYLNNGA